MGSDWWQEVLLFYAGEVGDITDLVELCEEQAMPSMQIASILRKMVVHAPYTQQVAVEIIEDRIRDAKASVARERENSSDEEAEGIEEDLAPENPATAPGSEADDGKNGGEESDEMDDYEGDSDM
jgi:cobalamin biosynthesis protein CobT